MGRVGAAWVLVVLAACGQAAETPTTPTARPVDPFFDGAPSTMFGGPLPEFAGR